MDSDPSLDPSQLAQIDQLEVFRPGARRQLVALFDEACDRQMPLLASALEVARGDEARRLAHSLKGVASGLGAVRLSRLAERVERCAGEGDVAAALRWFTQMQDERDAVRDALRRWTDPAADASTGSD